MSVKFYRLYCESCNFNRITDGTDIDDLYEYTRNKIPTALPKLDPITKKIVTKDPKALPKQFRCPNCGRPITPKRIKEPKKIEDEQNQDNDGGSEEGSERPELS